MKISRTPLKSNFDHLLVGLAAGFETVDLSKIRPAFAGTIPAFAPESFERPAFDQILLCACASVWDGEPWLFDCLAGMELVFESKQDTDDAPTWNTREKADPQRFILESVARHFEVESDLPFGWCVLRGRKRFEWRLRGTDLGDRIMSEHGSFLTRACTAIVRRHVELLPGSGLGLTFLIRDPYSGHF